MANAHYELLDGGEGFSGEIPGFRGVLANAVTLEGCREELASTLEDWLLFRISRGLPIPSVNGVSLEIREVGESVCCPDSGQSSGAILSLHFVDWVSQDHGQEANTNSCRKVTCL